MVRERMMNSGIEADAAVVPALRARTECARP